MKLRAPRGVVARSQSGEAFVVDEQGCIDVDDEVAEALVAIGYERVASHARAMVEVKAPAGVLRVQSTDGGETFEVDRDGKLLVPVALAEALLESGDYELLVSPEVKAQIEELRGPQGERGEQGPQGAVGAPGALGPKGDRGERGEPGPQGPQGSQGERGPSPEHRWIETRLQFKQPDGRWGVAVDLRGPQGTGGVGGGNGMPGVPGPQGPQGAQGSGTGGTSDGSVPYFVPADETFTVPIYRQALFARTIDCEGTIDLEGDLILVN